MSSMLVPQNSTFSAPARSTFFPFLHISTSTWSEPPQTSAASEGDQDEMQRLHFGCFFNSDANGGRACDPIAFKAREEEETLKNRIQDAVEKVQIMKDVPGTVDYIAQVLEESCGDKSLYSFVKSTVLEACDRLSDEVDCVCKTQSSTRYLAILFLLAQLARREIIPAAAVFEMADRVILEVNRPFRIEGAILLLLYPESGILVNTEHAGQMRAILGEMMRRRVLLGVMRCKCNIPK